MSSILTLQATAMEALIKTMTTTGGYNYNWLTVNQRDYALGTFPRAEIYSPEEENLDDIGGIGSNDYTNKVVWEIHVTGKITTSSVNPIFDINDIHSLALDDLKMLFGINRSLSGTCDSFLYRGMTREIKAVDQFIPTKIITKWQAIYSQDRITPSQFASS